MDKTIISTAGMGTAFRIDSHSRTTMRYVLILKTEETALRSFRSDPYSDIGAWMAHECF